MKSREEIYEFMNARSLCVVSTVNRRNHPESAMVGFGQTKDLQIVFRTSIDSRKAKNLQAVNHVAVVIGDQEGTIQCEGTARVLEGEEADRYSLHWLAKNPWAKGKPPIDAERFVLVQPRWIRFTDATTHPWDVTQLSL